MTGKDKEKPLAELTDRELEMIIGRRDEKPDVVKKVSEGFDRVLKEVLGEKYVAPGKEEDRGRNECDG